MSDDKAAAAYHPLPAPEPAHDGECSSLYGRALGRDDACDCAPVTRPDLDALIAEAKEYAGLDQYPGAVLIRELAAALAAERARADQAEQECDSVIERVIELHDRTDTDRHDVDDALMLRGHRAIDADDRLALTRDEWATYYTMIGRNGEATRILDHLAAIVSLRGAEYDLYTPPELAARKAN